MQLSSIAAVQEMDRQTLIGRDVHAIGQQWKDSRAVQNTAQCKSRTSCTVHQQQRRKKKKKKTETTKLQL